MDPQRGTGGSARLLNGGAILVEQCDQASRRCDSAFGGVLHALEEVVDPCLPVTVLPNGVEQAIVFGPVRLEMEAEVEEGFTDDAGLTEEQRDEQTPDAPVSVPGASLRTSVAASAAADRRIGGFLLAMT
ncbi:MAG: hypothetical protein U0470_01375 [Anaerolineae bacterium]